MSIERDGFVSRIENSQLNGFAREATEESASATITFVEEMKKIGSPLVLPTITPRFALSCSKELLRELGHIAKRFDLHIQSHISENLAEIEVVRGIFNNSYAGAYDDAGLLTDKVSLSFSFFTNLFTYLQYVPFLDGHGAWGAPGGRRNRSSERSAHLCGSLSCVKHYA